MLDELKQIALEKDPNGCASSLAIEAQKALYWRRTCRRLTRKDAADLDERLYENS